MARLYAQFAAVLFIVTGAAGFLTGDAGRVVGGQATGNVDGVALHLTYAHDILNLLFGAAFGYAGWRAKDSIARTVVLVTGALLLLLAAIGFALGDDAGGTKSIATLHFPVAINILDLVTGALAILCGLGSIGEPLAAAG